MKCTRIGIKELVPPEVYDLRGEQAWELIDVGLIYTIDALDVRFPGILINNWHVGGNLKYCGFRPPECLQGAHLSQHRRGCALDGHFSHHTPQEVHAYILGHPTEFPYVTCLEEIASTPTWVHIDCRNSNWTGIKLVKP